MSSPHADIDFPGVAPSRQKRSRETTLALLQAGAEMLRGRSLAELSIETLCARVGATVGAFYSRFDSKEAYFNALVALAARDGETLEFPPPEQIPGDGPRRFSFPEFRGLTNNEILSNQNAAAGNSGLGAGDSGGPLFWVAPNGELILVGIHRATDAQRVALAFDLRTDVPQVLDFLDLVVGMVEEGLFD